MEVILINIDNSLYYTHKIGSEILKKGQFKEETINAI